MNMAPKPRPLWQRVGIVFGLSLLLTWKVLHLPSRILPRDLKAIVRNWTYKMYWVVMRSAVQRAYIDQTCTYRPPASFQPQAEVEPQHRLTESQIRQFHEQGFLGPFPAFSKAEMLAFRQELIAEQETISKTYGFETPRDRHFEMPSLMEKMTHPAITDRCAQLLGSDLLCWRSQIFYKMAGAPRIQWHQASTFMVEDYLDPAIFPADRDSLFQLTAWVAVDDSTTENGCVEFLPGSQSSIRTIDFGTPKEEGFYNANFDLEFDEDPSTAVRLEVPRGHFILFTERCIHGSSPNTSPRDRLAFNFRVIPTNVAVYPKKKHYRSVYNGGKYYLDDWGVVCIRGEDREKLSRTIDVETLLGESQAPLRKAA